MHVKIQGYKRWTVNEYNLPKCCASLQYVDTIYLITLLVTLQVLIIQCLEAINCDM